MFVIFTYAFYLLCVAFVVLAVVVVADEINRRR